MKEIKSFLRKHWFILIILTVVFLLRLPSLFEPYWYGDEGVYLTVGQGIARGRLLYRDIFDNKTPMIYLLAAAAGGTLVWLRVFLLVSTLATIFFFYELGQKLFVKESWELKAATLFLAFLTTFLLEGNIANAEIFILLPTLAGLNLIFSQLKTKKPQAINFFLAGLILSGGFLTKVPAVLDFGAILIFLIFLRDTRKFLHFGKEELLLIAGYLLPIALTFFYFGLKGAFHPFFNACFVQMIGYLSSWETGTHSSSVLSLLKSEIALRGVLTLILLILVEKYRKKIPETVLFSFTWFVLALFGATLSGRPYPHYLIQVIPPLAISFGLLLSPKTKPPIITNMALILIILSLALGRYWRKTWVAPLPSYYQNFFQFILGQKSKEAYFAYFNPQMPQMYRLAEFIKASTKPTEEIFIWGDDPSLYALSRRLPVTIYTTAYHIKERHQENLVLQSLAQKNPPLIVVDEDSWKFPELAQFLKSQYFQLTDFGHYTVYILSQGESF